MFLDIVLKKRLFRSHLRLDQSQKYLLILRQTNLILDDQFAPLVAYFNVVSYSIRVRFSDDHKTLFRKYCWMTYYHVQKQLDLLRVT